AESCDMWYGCMCCEADAAAALSVFSFFSALAFRSFVFCMLGCTLGAALFPYTTLLRSDAGPRFWGRVRGSCEGVGAGVTARAGRSEEHTSELQSRENLVCRLLLEKKKSSENTNYAFY